MSNIPQYSVSEFSKTIKMVVEDAFGYVKIKGEISGFKQASSGHCYFSLKDENAILSAVCFSDYADLIDFNLEDGLEVVAFGKISVYGARSGYQIIVEKVEIAGVGAIMEILEKRRQKFFELGFFDEKHKKKLPFFPKKIGVITSENGAVIQDILHRVENRCPTEILLYNVAVQGKNCAFEVVKAIKFFDKLKGKKRPDLLIIARGGGSIEDLLPFSDEDLVKTAFACKLPIISAVGHETDFCLLDFVADLRAPTPSAAAEMATILYDDLVEEIQYLQKNLTMFFQKYFAEKAKEIQDLTRFIKKPSEIFVNLVEKIDKLNKNFDFLIKYNFDKKQNDLSQILLSKKDFYEKINEKTQKIQYLSEIFRINFVNIFKKFEDKINNLEKLLEAKNHKAILNRGFALVKDKNNRLISSLENVKIKEEISIEVRDGEFSAYVFGAKKIKNEQKSEKDDLLTKLI